MNVKLLRKVKVQILKVPRQFQMAHLWATADEIGRELIDIPRAKVPGCGTAACIAGWTLALATSTNPSDLRGSAHVGDAARALGDAARALELGPSNDALFFVGKWPESFRKRWCRSRSITTRARVAADRIDHFIKTFGQE